MSDINTILAKYFAGESTAEDDKFVRAFITENPKEYRALEKLWHSKKTKIRDFDPESAWKKVTKKAPGSPVIKSLFRKVTSIALVFFLLAATLFYFLNRDSNQDWDKIVNDNPSPIAIVLPDNSRIYLNRNAKISHPKSFNNKYRRVKMDGEVFFEVQEDTKRPFEIETPQAMVTVLGTSFNIDATDLQTEVSVSSGKVKVEALSMDGSALLMKGQKAVATRAELLSSTIENPNFMAWKTGIFKFDNRPISEVVSELNSYYDNQIVLPQGDYACLLSTTFDNLRIEEIIQIIELTCDIKIREKKGNYELY